MQGSNGKPLADGEKTNPCTPKQSNGEFYLLCYAFQRNDREMLSTGQVADFKLELLAATAAHLR
jgi:hypothetical protein